jgi:hypothetical protein
MMKKILIWLEDKPEDLADLIAKTKKKFDEVIIRRFPMGIKNALEEIKKDPKARICGIVIDVMLPNVEDLEGVGLRHIKIPGGFDTGILFMKHFLLKDQKWKRIPMCIFTVIDDHRVNELIDKDIDIKNLLSENTWQIQTIEKFITGWEEKFLTWLDKLLEENEEITNGK